MADTYCAKCGMRQPVTPGAPPPVPATDPLASLHPRTASVLCYVPGIGWIVSIVVLAADRFRHDRVVRFHAFQGLYLFAVWLLLTWAGPIMDNGSGHFLRADHLLEALLLGVSIFMMIKASHEETYVLPIIGELAKRSATE